MSPDAVVPETGASPSTAAVPEPLPDEHGGQQPPPAEEQIVIPLEAEEEESISSTITLLEKDEESDGEREKRDGHQAQHVDLCAFASRPCGASLREYLQQQCLVPLSRKRKCQPADRKQRAPSNRTPAWPPLSPSSSACPEPERDRGAAPQPHQNRPAPEGEPESRAGPSRAPRPPEKTLVRSHSDSASVSPLLEPSQTSSLAKTSAPDSSAANPTVVETPQLPSEAPAKPRSSEESQDAPAEASLPPSSSVMAAAADDDGKAAPTELAAGALLPRDSPPNPDMTGESRTASPRAPQSPEPAAVLDGDAPSVETSPPPPPHTPVEPELSSSAPILPDDLTEDASTPGLPSTSPSPSLSDIYADPPNGTEQNGNPVHGSGQKESVFMRLNNRIKALEMNMSLSGRYLEQLSQRSGKEMTHTHTHTLACFDVVFFFH